MAIYRLKQDSLSSLPETRFSDRNIHERKHLQRSLRENIGTLSPDLMVISEEFSRWNDSSRRIDLLCLDRDANLVIVELKRTEDGGYMELQAIRYAAMISSMTFDQLVDAHAEYIEKNGKQGNESRQQILEFLGWESANEDRFADTVRIILAAADFSKELTTSVLWLNEMGLEISCIRLKPYVDHDQSILLDVQQLIPLPEAAEYQTQIKAKELAGKSRFTERHDVRLRFWTKLLELARPRTQLHAGCKPTRYNFIQEATGHSGVSFNYAVRMHDSQVELYIDVGDEADNLKILRLLERHKAKIELDFGTALEWQELPDRRACRVRYVLSGGWRSPESEWLNIQLELITKMIALEKALRPFIDGLEK